MVINLIFSLCLLPFSNVRVQYEYRVHRAPYMDYSTKEIVPLVRIDDSQRLLRKRYQVRVVFVQSGSLGTTLVMVLG